MSPEFNTSGRGQAKHRRRELAQQRKQLPASPVTEKVSVVGLKRQQLREISEKLKLDTLALTERVTLTFKEIWLKADPEVREISDATRKEQLQKLERTWKERFPETCKWFFEETLPDGRTRAFQTRQEVAPDQAKPYRQIRP